MEMSINRALAELKLLDKKIEKGIEKNQHVAAVIGKRTVKGYNSVDEFIADAKAKYQSLMALIKLRQEIKSAIVASNAVTVVQVAGESMTVAEAIDRKTFIKHKQNLWNKLTSELNKTHDYVEMENSRVQGNLDNMLQLNFGKDAKTSKDEVESISKPYLENNQAKIIDPLNARVIADKLEKEIDEFLSEVDFVLTDSNTLTKIEIKG